MLKFLIIFAVILIAMGVGLPAIGIQNIPLWQVACGAFVVAAPASYLWKI